MKQSIVMLKGVLRVAPQLLSNTRCNQTVINLVMRTVNQNESCPIHFDLGDFIWCDPSSLNDLVTGCTELQQDAASAAPATAQAAAQAHSCSCESGAAKEKENHVHNPDSGAAADSAVYGSHRMAVSAHSETECSIAAADPTEAQMRCVTPAASSHSGAQSQGTKGVSAVNMQSATPCPAAFRNHGHLSDDAVPFSALPPSADTTGDRDGNGDCGRSFSGEHSRDNMRGLSDNHQALQLEGVKTALPTVSTSESLKLNSSFMGCATSQSAAHVAKSLSACSSKSSAPKYINAFIKTESKGMVRPLLKMLSSFNGSAVGMICRYGGELTEYKKQDQIQRPLSGRLTRSDNREDMSLMNHCEVMALVRLS